jgi:hypothetical protein
MSLRELDAAIATRRTESVALAMSGDFIGAMEMHLAAAQLERQRREILAKLGFAISEK